MPLSGPMRRQASSKRCRPKARRKGRPPAFDREHYKRRNLVERCFNKLKHWRTVACRFDKRALNHRAGSCWPPSCSGYGERSRVHPQQRRPDTT
jgi:transposase